MTMEKSNSRQNQEITVTLFTARESWNFRLSLFTYLLLYLRTSIYQLVTLS